MKFLDLIHLVFERYNIKKILCHAIEQLFVTKSDTVKKTKDFLLISLNLK